MPETAEFAHEPVLCAEVVRLLVPEAPRSGLRVLDLTVGLGGHARALLEALPADASFVGVDRDTRALGIAERRLARFGERVRLVHGRFGAIAERVAEAGWQGVDLVVADLGVSSMQLDDTARGFGFRATADLDMRMDTGSGATAAEILATASESEIADLIHEYGEDRDARRIARAIVRGERPRTTTELRERVAGAVRHRPAHRDPATLTFQALRIAVNRELEELDALLAALPGCLAAGGRVAILSYHSLEDRRVKTAFRAWSAACTCPPSLLLCRCGGVARARLLARGAVQSGPGEVARNPRARSARLRALEWIGGR
jgi:16S rRNA (cytosine1402-N4)-methyltransferase